MNERAGKFGLTEDVVRGVSRLLLNLGYSPLHEFTLPNGRRVDVAGVSDSGQLAAVEIKVSVEDFRGDAKWPDYVEFCDRYYFAVPEGFPEEILPTDHGLIVADKFGAALVRESPQHAVAAPRRKAMLIRFARVAAERHARLIDPNGIGLFR